MKSRTRLFALMFVLVSLLAAVPFFFTAGIELARLGPPPTVILDDGSVIGGMTLVERVVVYYRALFDFDPPESLDTLIKGYWRQVGKALLSTGMAVSVLTIIFMFLRDMKTIRSVRVAIGGIVGLWWVSMATMGYEKIMGYPHASIFGPRWGLIMYSMGIVGVALFLAARYTNHRPDPESLTAT